MNLESTPPTQYVAFDLETTGLVPKVDRVVEVGAVRFDETGRELGRFERLVNPCRSVPAGARAIHGLSDAILAEAATAEEVLPEFLEFLGDPATTTLMAHHATFDAGMLGSELARMGRPMPGHAVVDTLALARARLPQAPDHRLGTLALMLGLDPDGPHRALADSLRVKDLWLALNQLDGERPPLVSFPIFDPVRPAPAPLGWDLLGQAMARGLTVRITYAGGTRGTAPRDITPRRFVQRGGAVYLVALCHHTSSVKEFRLDRVLSHEVAAPVEKPGMRG